MRLRKIKEKTNYFLLVFNTPWKEKFYIFGIAKNKKTIKFGY
jgi:hypothetical protein